MSEHYVYILVNEENPRRHYVGRTMDLDARVGEHNRSKCGYTARFGKWRLETYISFRDESKAIAFERYLKTGSGREFSRRHF